MEPAGDENKKVTQAALEAVARASDHGAQPPGRRREDGGTLSRRARMRRIRSAVGGTARRGAKVTASGLKLSRRRLSAELLAMAPRLPVRDAATLHAQFPGRSADELAAALVAGAAKASAAVGAAVGVWAVLPVVPAAGFEIAAETLAVVGIEVKLVAELHEVYGMRAPGGLTERMTAYVAAWSQRRGVVLAPGGLVIAAGSPIRRQLQRRLARRAGRSVFSLGPLLTGAAAGALLNRRETRKLGALVSADLRERSRRRVVRAEEAAPGQATAPAS